MSFESLEKIENRAIESTREVHFNDDEEGEEKQRQRREMLEEEEKQRREEALKREGEWKEKRWYEEEAEKLDDPGLENQITILNMANSGPIKTRELVLMGEVYLEEREKRQEKKRRLQEEQKREREWQEKVKQREAGDAKKLHELKAQFQDTVGTATEARNYRKGESVTYGDRRYKLNGYDKQTGEAILEEQERFKRELFTPEMIRTLPQIGRRYDYKGNIYEAYSYDDETGDLLLKREFRVNKKDLK